MHKNTEQKTKNERNIKISNSLKNYFKTEDGCKEKKASAKRLKALRETDLYEVAYRESLIGASGLERRRKISQTSLRYHRNKTVEQREAYKLTRQRLWALKSDSEKAEILRKARSGVLAVADQISRSLKTFYTSVSSDYFIDVTKKRHETMKRNGTYGTSKPETNAHLFLCQLFGDENIERQKVTNNKWAIDHYISLFNLYIQTDSLYWHGLDRPIEKILEFKTERDEMIYRHYLNDLKQNKWFLENKKVLIRITDIEVNSCTDQNDYLDLIICKLREHTLAKETLNIIDKIVEENIYTQTEMGMAL